jgi:hypothetical protein
MNLFWKNLFGKIPSTAAIEQHEVELLNAMRRYDSVEKSVELAEYQQLFHEVKSANFIENKKTLKNRKYKDTEEYRNQTKLQKLEASPSIKLYFKTLQSAELKQYQDFESTEEFELLGDRKKVKASPKLLKLKQFQKSAAYKNYMRYHNSYKIKELDDLRKLCSTDEFKAQNHFWANPHRWQTTDEYVKEQRYYTLHKNPDIQFFVNEKPERFEPYRKRKTVFDENFDWNTLDKSDWNFGFHYASAQLIGNHSFANEKQANNEGRNVNVDNGILKIHTKAEKQKAAAWDTAKGFVEKEFDFTSDVLQTAEKLRINGGTIQAKIRCTGKIHHAFWLGSDAKLPHINIFHFDGKKIRLGNVNKTVEDGAVVNGLNPAKFYIYTLKWTKKELLWLINDYPIYRTASNIPKENMYLVFNSFISATQKGDSGTLEVDWVRVYD